MGRKAGPVIDGVQLPPGSVIHPPPSSDDDLPLFGDEDEEAEAAGDTLAGDPD